jgi:hypothetical protein
VKKRCQAVVELGTEVTVEDICYEGNYLCCCFLLGLSTGFLYYGMSTLRDRSLCVFSKGNERMGIRQNGKGEKGY